MDCILEVDTLEMPGGSVGFIGGGGLIGGGDIFPYGQDWPNMDIFAGLDGWEQSPDVEVLSGCNDTVESWLRFERDNLNGTRYVGSWGDQKLQRIVNWDCRETCAGGDAHAFHRPQLLNMMNTSGGYFHGTGWVMRGNNPVRRTAEEDSVQAVRFVEVFENGVNALIFALRRSDDVLLMKMERSAEHEIEIKTTKSQGRNSHSTPVEKSCMRKVCVGCLPFRECSPVCVPTDSCRREHCCLGRPSWFELMERGNLAGSWYIVGSNRPCPFFWTQNRDHFLQSRCISFINCTNSRSKTSPVRDIAKPDLDLEAFAAQLQRTMQSTMSDPAPNSVVQRCESNDSNSTSSAAGSTLTKCISDRQCRECGKSFAAKSKLVRHVNTVHRNLRAHGCNLCQKRFKEKGHLQKHMKSHLRAALASQRNSYTA